MTEYDYSPGAIERHLAKQAAISNWVEKTKQHEPANPFIKLPNEHARQYPQHRQVYVQPATTPKGVIYLPNSFAHKSTKKKYGSHQTSSRHSSSSRRLHQSSTSRTLPTLKSSSPQTRSYSISPPISHKGTAYLRLQGVQPPSLMQFVNVVQQRPYPLPVGSSTLAIQPTPNQPVVVPINGGVGGYVVVPAQGVTIVVSVHITLHDGGVIYRSNAGFSPAHMFWLCPTPASSLPLLPPFSNSFLFRSANESSFLTVTITPVQKLITQFPFMRLGLAFRTRRKMVFLW